MKEGFYFINLLHKVQNGHPWWGKMGQLACNNLIFELYLRIKLKGVGIVKQQNEKNAKYFYE